MNALSGLIPRLKRIFSSWSVRVPVIVIAALVVGAVVAPYLLRPPSLGDVGFSYSPDPVSLFHLPGSTTVTFTSYNGFSGTLNVKAFWGSPVPVVSPSSVYLPSGGSANVKVSLSGVLYYTPVEVQVEVSIPNSVAAGSLGRVWLIEVISNYSLVLQSYIFPSSTSATLNMYDEQAYAIAPTSYAVSDSSGNQYAFNYSSPGPSCCPRLSATNLQVLIGSSCPGCTLKGSPFSFTTGNSYTVILETSPSYQFVFIITR